MSETPAKGGGGLVETRFSSLGRMVAFPGKRPWDSLAGVTHEYRNRTCRAWLLEKTDIAGVVTICLRATLPATRTVRPAFRAEPAVSEFARALS
jgi:hypothetical protein